jgi:hypothetical protein
MTGFGTGALKKADRSARGDQRGCGDCGGYEETNRDTLWDDLQDASAAFGKY